MTAAESWNNLPKESRTTTSVFVKSSTDKVIIGSFSGFQKKSIRITERCNWYAVYMSSSWFHICSVHGMFIETDPMISHSYMATASRLISEQAALNSSGHSCKASLS